MQHDFETEDDPNSAARRLLEVRQRYITCRTFYRNYMCIIGSRRRCWRRRAGGRSINPKLIGHVEHDWLSSSTTHIISEMMLTAPDQPASTSLAIPPDPESYPATRLGPRAAQDG